MTNQAAPRFFGRFTDISRITPHNMLHLMFDPQGLRPFIADWPAVAQSLMQRVYRESVGRIIDEKTRQLLDSLRAYPDVEPGWSRPLAGAPAAIPVIPIGLVLDGKLLNYVSMVTTLGTPFAVAAQELRLECMFPADDETEALHLALGGA